MIQTPVSQHGTSPFHAGEQALQRRAGSREWLAYVGERVIRSALPRQHREFFEQLPFIALAAVDAGGQPQATLLAGPPGFVRSPDETHLHVAALPPQDDPVAAVLQPGAAVGMLGIELPTRRRSRANGRVESVGHDAGGGFTLRVEQSFGNCPQYIQRRETLPGATPLPGTTWQGVRVEGEALAMVQAADTFFIASHAGGGQANSGADISHRGGQPGFLRADDDGQTLTWPDYPGNRFFNTLGNLAVEPRAALVIPDFASGDLLHVTGRAEILWGDAERASFAGAERLLRLRVEQVLLRRGAWPLRWRRSGG